MHHEADTFTDYREVLFGTPSTPTHVLVNPFRTRKWRLVARTHPRLLAQPYREASHFIERRAYKGTDPILYPVWSLEEADREGIDYVHWTDLALPEHTHIAFVHSDDGYVVAVRNIKRMKKTTGNRCSWLLNLAIGKMIITRNMNTGKISGDPVYQIEPWLVLGTGYSDRVPRTTGEEELTRTRMKRAITFWVHLTVQALLEKRGLTRDEWVAIGIIYRNDQQHPDRTIRVLFRNPAVRAAAMKELAEAFSDADFTTEEALRMFRETYSDVKERKATDAQVSMVEMAMQMTELLPTKGILPKGKGYPAKWQSVEEGQGEIEGSEEDDFKALMESERAKKETAT